MIRAFGLRCPVHLSLSHRLHSDVTDEQEWPAKPLADLQTALEAQLERVEDKLDRYEEGDEVSYAAEDRLLSMFLGKVDQQTERLREVGRPGVGGVQADIYLGADGVKKIDTVEKERLLKLTDSVREYWSEASWAYIRENFRGCIFASATMLEGGLKLKIHEEEQ